MHLSVIIPLNSKVNKEKLFLILIFSFISTIFWGCTSRTVQPSSEYEPVLIQSKALIKNDNESNTIKIEIALLPKKAIRLEISASLGVSVATVLLTPNEIAYALHSTKQFSIGPFNEKTLYPVFKKNIDPRILWRVINNQPMTNLNLKCVTNDESRPVTCVSVDGTTIKWTYEVPPRKRVDIISNRFEMSWLFRDQRLFTGSQNETFVLKKPDNYQEIIIK